MRQKPGPMDTAQHLAAHQDPASQPGKSRRRDANRHSGKDELRDQAARLRHIKGIGPIVSATLIAQLPELGQLDRRRIAALAGLAPHANDFGHRRGKRSIWGGCGMIRRSLYLGVLTASRFDPRFKAFKEHLIAAGKAMKLVIVACARKLLTVLNAMMRTGTTYQNAVA